MQGSSSYGVSREGIQAVYKKIHTHLIDDATVALNNESVISAIRAGWSGKDCETFITNFISLKDKLIKQLNSYDLAIADEFYLLQQQWEKFQETNVKNAG